VQSEKHGSFSAPTLMIIAILIHALYQGIRITFAGRGEDRGIGRQLFRIACSTVLLAFTFKIVAQAKGLITTNQIDNFFVGWYFLMVLCLIKGSVLLNAMALMQFTGRMEPWSIAGKVVASVIFLFGLIASFGFDNQEFPIFTLSCTALIAIMSYAASIRRNRRNEHTASEASA
jgi:hypothetical protein